MAIQDEIDSVIVAITNCADSLAEIEKEHGYIVRVDRYKDGKELIWLFLDGYKFTMQV